MAEDASNVVSIKQHTVMSKTIAYCDSRIVDPTFTQVTLIGEGKAVNKCISIVEILKRTHTDIVSQITLDESPNTENEPRLTVLLSKAVV
jgi:DNA-binding protein